jgi:hypothetical protein
MARFDTGVEVQTQDPIVEVSSDPDATLSPGKHRFQLVVEDDTGNQSEPATVEIIIVDNKKSTAVIDAPATVLLGSSFKLTGNRSTDLPTARKDCGLSLGAFRVTTII